MARARSGSTRKACHALTEVRDGRRAMARVSEVAVRVLRAAIGAVLALVGVGALGSCFGDPPSDPATAPLEVVIEGCVPNRSQVAPGTHEVAVINHGEYQSGKLVVAGEDGAQVLTVDVGEAEQLVTTDQRYTFTCDVGSDQSTSTLDSKVQ